MIELIDLLKEYNDAFDPLDHDFKFAHMQCENCKYTCQEKDQTNCRIHTINIGNFNNPSCVPDYIDVSENHSLFYKFICSKCDWPIGVFGELHSKTGSIVYNEPQLLCNEVIIKLIIK